MFFKYQKDLTYNKYNTLYIIISYKCIWHIYSKLFYISKKCI